MTSSLGASGTDRQTAEQTQVNKKNTTALGGVDTVHSGGGGGSLRWRLRWEEGAGQGDSGDGALEQRNHPRRVRGPREVED